MRLCGVVDNVYSAVKGYLNAPDKVKWANANKDGFELYANLKQEYKSWQNKS